MNLKDKILKDYKSINDFAVKNQLSATTAYYWVNTDWERLTYTTKKKIGRYFK